MNSTHYKQLDFMDCGPTCIQMGAKHYCKSYMLGSAMRSSLKVLEHGVTGSLSQQPMLGRKAYSVSGLT